MAKCETCGQMILAGGKTEGGLRFCSEKCFQNGAIARFAQSLPAQQVEEEVAKVHGGACPGCGGNGPVDIHFSHSIWSAIYLSSWKSTPQLSCRSCALKSQIRGALFSLVLGWWGVPWGLLLTPVQIGRNIWGMIRPPAAAQPSDKLRETIRAEMGARLWAQQTAASPGENSKPPIPEPSPMRGALPSSGPIAHGGPPENPFSNQDAFKS